MPESPSQMDGTDVATGRSRAPLDLARYWLVWWSDVLAGLLPAPIRAWFDSLAGLHALLPGEAGSPARHWLRRGAAWVETADPAPTGRGHLILLAPGETGLRRMLDLPPAARPGTIQHALARFIPFPLTERAHPDPQGCWGWRVAEPGLDQDRIEATVLPGGARDRLLAGAQALGLRPDFLVLGPDRAATDAASLPRSRRELLDLNLLGNAPQARGLPQPGWVLAGLLAVAALASPLLRDHLATERLRDETAALLATRAAVDPATAHARRLAGELAERLPQRPPVIALLTDLTAALPDGSWVSGVAVGDGKLSFEGRSRSVAELVRRIEGQAGFGALAFPAPVVRDPQSGQEQFQISVALTKGAAAP